MTSPSWHPKWSSVAVVLYLVVVNHWTILETLREKCKQTKETHIQKQKTLFSWEEEENQRETEESLRTL
jgi:hypothetical protein